MNNEIYEYLINYGFNKENLKRFEEENDELLPDNIDSYEIARKIIKY